MYVQPTRRAQKIGPKAPQGPKIGVKGPAGTEKVKKWGPAGPEIMKIVPEGPQNLDFGIFCWGARAEVVLFYHENCSETQSKLSERSYNLETFSDVVVHFKCCGCP